MASNDITKFVDGNGDEFNFRDPTKQPTADRVTSIRASSSASDDKYPSEKAVATALSAKANISLDNTNVSALKNLYAATDGYASHSNIAVGYGLLATIDTSSISGYSDVHAIFELYDLQSGQNRTGYRTLSVNIRNNSPTAGAGSYVYKISVVEHPPVNSQFSIVAYRTGDADLRIYSVGIGTNNYGGILCRLVSCTTFYGSGLYSLVTLSRSTASSIVPSGTEVSVTVVKELGETDIRTIPQDVSKGANLVVNGSGRMANNYNFGSFLYIPTICCNGSAGSFGFNGSLSIDEFISVDFTKQVLFTADVKNLVAQPSNCVHRIYVAEYDIDKKSVQAIHVTFGVGTLTELTQDLNPGDTVVHLADLSNSNWKPSQTYQRGFIFWNYQNSFGYTYPPETYSRNVYPSSDSNALYTNDGVDVANGTITLINAWSGPTIPAGTKVSRRNSGGTYPYPANVTASDTEWHHLSGIISGIAAPGSSSRGSVFSQGVAYIKVGMYPTSLSNTDDVTGKRAVLANLSVYELQDTFGGVLPVAKGGTGRSSVTSGYYMVGAGTYGNSAFEAKSPKQTGNNVLSSLDEGTAALSTDNAVLITGDAAAANTTTFYRRKFSYIWTWIKSKLSSDSGVNISGSSASCTGNAATATKATQDSDGNAINATYFKSSGNTTLVAGAATKIGTQNGAYVELTLPAHQDISGKMNTSASNATAPSGSGGDGATATLLNNLTDGNSDIVTTDDGDNVLIATTDNGGSVTNKWYKRKLVKLIPWIIKKLGTRLVYDCGAGSTSGDDFDAALAAFNAGQWVIIHDSTDVYYCAGTYNSGLRFRKLSKSATGISVNTLNWTRGSSPSAGTQLDASLSDHTHSQYLTASSITGKMNTNADNAASGALQNLTGQLTEGTSDFTDNTEIFTSYAGNNGFAESGHVNQPYRRKASSMLNYVRDGYAIDRNPASVGTTHKRISLGYGKYNSSAVGAATYLVHLFFNYVDSGGLQGKGITVLVTYDFRSSSYQKSECRILSDNGVRDAGYNVVLANFISGSGDSATLHICIGLVKNSAPTTLVEFNYSYCKIFKVCTIGEWTQDITSDAVGTYNYLVQATDLVSSAVNADMVDGKHIVIGSWAGASNTIYFG